jgi:hypothetical protein
MRRDQNRRSDAVAVRLTAILATLLAGWPALMASARASDVRLMNDTLPDASGGMPCNCFVAGNRAAARLTATCAGDIAGVEVLWRSPRGGAPAATEHALVIAEAAPGGGAGAPLVTRDGVVAVIESPTLVDGRFNEFRSLDAAGTRPLRVPIGAGGSFAVALEFANTVATAALPATLVYDADGCTRDRNAIYGDGTWRDGCAQGLLGDLAIRAVVDCHAIGSATRLALLSGALALMLVAGFGAVRFFGRRGRRV